MRQLFPVLLILGLGSGSAFSAGAECDVTFGEMPINLDVARLDAKAFRLSDDPFDSPLAVKGIVAADAVWYIPHFRIDRSAEAGENADATIWSVRNESEAGESVDIRASYFTTDFDPQGAQEFTLGEKELRSVSLRSVEGLRTERDGFARGFIRVTPSVSRRISVDFFQVDFSQNSATGSLASSFPCDFCDQWQLRFLRFGEGSGSIATFFVNGPLAAGSPTVVGNVYGEDGSFVSSFSIRSTGDWTFQCDIQNELVNGDVRFGTIELNILSGFEPSGIVSVSHSAFGAFSVGVPSICLERDELISTCQAP